MRMGYPKMVIFDLDYTFWPCWCDTHLCPPIRVNEVTNVIQDRFNTEVTFYKDVPKILSHLADLEIPVATASRTHKPAIARQMLEMLTIEGMSADTLIYYQMYGTWSKIGHIDEIHKITKIDYEDMILFDDELPNNEVEDLGVTFQLVEHGLTWEIFNQGIMKWKINQGMF